MKVSHLSLWEIRNGAKYEHWFIHDHTELRFWLFPRTYNFERWLLGLPGGISPCNNTIRQDKNQTVIYLLLDLDVELADTLEGKLLLLHENLDRVPHEPLRHLQHLIWHCSRQQDHLGKDAAVNIPKSQKYEDSNTQGNCEGRCSHENTDTAHKYISPLKHSVSVYSCFQAKERWCLVKCTLFIVMMPFNIDVTRT